MTQTHDIPFGEWLPDLPPHRNPVALIAKNVIPQVDGYRSLNSISSFSNALANACLGSFWAQQDDGVISNFAGDSNALYELTTGTTWTDISGPSAPYSADNWDFTKFGERIIATSDQAAPQKFDMGTDVAFADLAGSPPNARYVATIRDFIMLGNIPSLGPNYVQWCGFNNTEQWTPSIATQSDLQPLYGRGGKIQRIVPGEYGVIFMERSIFTAEYRGLPTIFQFDEIEKKRGTPAPNSVAWSGNNVWYYGWDGFYVLQGAQSTPISANRVARWFNQNAASNALDSMRGAVDLVNRLVVWAFKSSASSAFNNRLIIYNWAADKWSYADVDTECISDYLTPGFTLDALDGPLPGGIDTDSIPVDSGQYQGGAINLLVFDSSHQSGTFDGTPLTACVETIEDSAPDQSRMSVNSIRPMVDGSPSTSITVELGCRNNLQETTVYETPRAVNTINNEANVRKNARYFRHRLNISGGFEHATGVKVNKRIGGRR